MLVGFAIDVWKCSKSDDSISPRKNTEVKFSSHPADFRTELGFAATVSFRNSFQTWQAQKYM